MKSSTLIVWLLVAACVAIDLAMIGELQIRRNEWPETGGVFGLGLAFSQITLIALWTVWGRRGVIVRAVSSLLSVAGMSCLASYSTDGGLHGAGMWFGVLLLYCGACVVPFVVARFSRYDLSQADEGISNVARVRLPASQFTIWGLMSLMTAVGITLAVLRFAEIPTDQLFEVTSFFAILAVTSCSVLLISLFVSRLSIAVVTTFVVAPLAGLLLLLTGLAPGDAIVELVLLTLTIGLLLLIAAITLRTAGYKLFRAGSFPAPN